MFFQLILLRAMCLCVHSDSLVLRCMMFFQLILLRAMCLCVHSDSLVLRCMMFIFCVKEALLAKRAFVAHSACIEGA